MPPQPPNADGRGLITLAVGDARFLEMAVDLALSARPHTSVPVALAADEALAAAAEARFPDVFDRVSRLEDRFLDGRGAKYGVVAASPFDEAIYLDADCLLLGGLDGFWDRFRPSPLSLQGEMLGPDTPAVHHGFPVADLMRRFGLDRYLKCNSGVFHFRRAEALGIMDECLRCYRDELRPHLKGGFVGDELALGVVGGRRDLALLPDPHPMYWREELAVLDPDRPHRPVLHLLAPLPPPAFERLMDSVESRRRDAGLETSSRPAWAWKQRRVARGRRLERLLRPLLPLARLLRLRATRHW